MLGEPLRVVPRSMVIGEIHTFCATSDGVARIRCRRPRPPVCAARACTTLEMTTPQRGQPAIPTIVSSGSSSRMWTRKSARRPSLPRSSSEGALEAAEPAASCAEGRCRGELPRDARCPGHRRTPVVWRVARGGDTAAAKVSMNSRMFTFTPCDTAPAVVTCKCHCTCGLSVLVRRAACHGSGLPQADCAPIRAWHVH